MTFAITQYQWADAAGTARPIYFGNDGTANAAVHLFTNPAGQLINPATQSAVTRLSSTLTRPANTTAYGAISTQGAGFIIGSSASTGGTLTNNFAGAVVASPGATTGTIFTSVITRSDTSFQSGLNIRAHFFSALPTLTSEVDGSGWAPHSVNSAIAVPGYIDHSLNSYGADCQVLDAVPFQPIPYVIASGTTLYCCYEVRNYNGWTPISSETFRHDIIVTVD